MTKLGINNSNTEILAATLYEITFEIEDRLNELKDVIAHVYEVISPKSISTEFQEKLNPQNE